MIKRTLFFAKPAYLNTKNEQLIVNYPDEPKPKIERSERLRLNSPPKKTPMIPIEDIAVVVLEDPQITISNALMRKLLQNNVALISCDEKHMPLGTFLPLRGHSEQSERFQLQIKASLPLKKNLWKQVIETKILNQAKVLAKNGVPEQHLIYLAGKVNSGDTHNIEARAAAFYWSKIFKMDGFTRQRFGEPPNNLLNYGYAVLRAVMARSLISSGLFPTFGIHHKNKYNAFCLADDMMEAYRPYVDEVVIEIMNEYEDISELTTELKMHLLQIPVLDVRIEERRSPLMIACSRTSNSLYESFAQIRRNILLPILHE
jgi:CRISPR-associated protein Cas1